MSVCMSFPFRAKKQLLLQSCMFISTITSWDYGYQFFLLYWNVVVSKLKLSIFCEQKTPRIGEVVSFVLGKEIEKYVFRLVTSVGQRKKSESPWVIEPQTFGFRARMLYHWATETTVSAESEGLRFNSSWGIKNVFLFPTLVTRRKTSFYISLRSSKITISLVLFTNMTLLTLLIQAVRRTRVIWTS